METRPESSEPLLKLASQLLLTLLATDDASLDQVMEGVLRAIGAQLGAEVCTFNVISQDHTSYTRTHQWLARAELMLPPPSPRKLTDWSRQLSAQPLLLIEDAAALPDTFAYLRTLCVRNGMGSLAALSWGPRDTPRASLICAWRKRQRLSEALDALLPVVAAAQQALEQRQARRVREEERALHHELFLACPQPIWIFARQSLTMLAINDAALRYSDAPREVIMERTLGELIAPQDHATLLPALMSAQRVVLGQARLIDASGQQRVVTVRAQALTFAGQQARALIAQDVSLCEHHERLLMHAEEAEAVSLFAAGAAHDLNNLLSVITGSASLALSSVGDDEAQEPLSSLHDILAAASRGAALTRQLLALSRAGVHEPQVTTLQPILSTIAPLLERMLPGHLKLKLALPTPPLWACVDRAALERALLNLVSNAVAASPHPGQLTLSLDALPYDALPCADRLDPVAHVRIALRDEGEGIPDALIASVCEPYVTTKPAGQGGGLGLATCVAIMQRHHGALDLQSSPRGTTCALYLPQLFEGLFTSGPWPTQRQRLTTRVVLWEPDLTQRGPIALALRTLGYRVLFARDLDALPPLMSASLAADALILSLDHSPQDALRASQRILASRPQARVLYLCQDDPARYGLDTVPETVLQRPFSPAQLGLTAARCLQHAPADPSP